MPSASAMPSAAHSAAHSAAVEASAFVAAHFATMERPAFVAEPALVADFALVHRSAARRAEFLPAMELLSVELLAAVGDAAAVEFVVVPTAVGDAGVVEFVVPVEVPVDLVAAPVEAAP